MDIRLVLVPYDSAHRATRMGAGPARLLELGLEDRLRALGHRVRRTEVLAPSDRLAAEIRTAFDLAEQVGEAVARAVVEGEFPLVLSGNCSSALGTLSGLRSDTRIAVAWFDAHGDFNTPETTVGGFLDGMALAILVGACWTQLTARLPGFRAVPEELVLLLGARDLDALEAQRLSRSRIRHLPPAAMRTDLPRVCREVAAGAAGLYVHIDLDVLDPIAEGRVNEFAAADGLTATELATAIGQLGASLPIRGGALTAYDPACDPDGRVGETAIGLALALVTEAALSSGNQSGMRHEG